MSKKGIGMVYEVTRNDLVKFLDDKKVAVKCPMCGNSGNDSFYTVAVTDDPDSPLSVISSQVTSHINQSVVESGFHRSFYQLTCNNCSYAVLFDANSIVRSISPS